MKQIFKIFGFAAAAGFFNIAASAQEPANVQKIVLDKPGEIKLIDYKAVPPKVRTQYDQSIEAAVFTVDLKQGAFLMIDPAKKINPPAIDCRTSQPAGGIVTETERTIPATVKWVVYKDGNAVFSADNGEKLIFAKVALQPETVRPFFRVPANGSYQIKIFTMDGKPYEDQAVVRYAAEEPQNLCTPPAPMTVPSLDPE